MARTANWIQLDPAATDDRRPAPIPFTSPGFGADLGMVFARQVDEHSVILVPYEYTDETPIDDPDSADAFWREGKNAARCWKTTVIYEQIDATHPHLVSYLGRDPWTACPLLAKPSGPPVTKFIQKSRAAMYSAPLDA